MAFCTRRNNGNHQKFDQQKTTTVIHKPMKRRDQNYEGQSKITENRFVWDKLLLMCVDYVDINLRPYVRRKSDLPLYIDQIHIFNFDTTPATLNDNVNTKSVWLNNLIDVCLQYCIETTWTMFQTVLWWEVNKDNSIHKSVVVELGFYLW